MSSPQKGKCLKISKHQFQASGLETGKCKLPKWRPGNPSLQKADEQVLLLYKGAYYHL